MSTRTPLQRAAIRLGAAHAYLTTYQQVMRQLEEEDNVPVLVPVINTLLDRMLALDQDAMSAAFGLQEELQTDGARHLVRAAVVDIVLHDRQAGQRITEVPTEEATLARA